MTSYSTGPFDPIAEAAYPDDPEPQTGPPSGPFTGPPTGPPSGAFARPSGGAFTGSPSGPFTRPSSGVFSEPPAAPPSGPFSAPPSGPFPVRRVRPGTEPPDHHEAARPDAAYADAAHHEPGHAGLHNDARYGATALADHPGMYGQDSGDDDQVWAMLSYLGMIFFAFLPPLAVYLLKRRESRYVRFHAAQALNLWITTFLYALSFAIIGGILALDTISTALSVGIPLVVATGIAMLLFAVRAALAASRGAVYQIPGWICVQMVT